jgi:hypothetical protein
MDMTGISKDLHDESVVRASATFAASAFARLTRALHEQGVIDDYLIGELAAVAADCGREAGTDAAVKAMEIIQADLGAPSRRQETRDAALDEAQAAEDAARDAQVAAHKRAG